MTSDWNGQQPAELHWSSDWSVARCVSKLISNILNICYDMFLRNFMTFKAYVTAVMSNSTYVSFHKVRWKQPSGQVAILSQVCCEFHSVSVCQKLSKYNAVWQNYCENKRVQFLDPQCIFVSHAVSEIFSIFHCEKNRKTLTEAELQTVDVDHQTSCSAAPV